MNIAQLTDNQLERLYRRAYYLMTECVGCTLVDWRTLYYLSPTWAETLKVIYLELLNRKLVAGYSEFIK